MKRSRLVLLVVGLLATPAAYAGLKYSLGVHVVRNADGSGQLYGTMSDARTAASSSAYLTCSVRASPGYAYAYCAGSDGTTYSNCLTDDKSMVDTMSKVLPDDYIAVTWDTSGTCTSVLKIVNSYVAPKTP